MRTFTYSLLCKVKVVKYRLNLPKITSQFKVSFKFDPKGRKY